MKALILTVSLALLASSALGKQPNIIYILADDLGWGDLGCYGQKVIQTPRLDQMAAEGMKFTRHYSGSTVCGPSRACLLEGKHSGNTYMRGNGQLQMREDPHEPILPSALKLAGYHTALIGKSGLACNSDDGGLPNRKGFDYFFGFSSHTQAHWFYPTYLWKNGTKVEYPNNTLHAGDNYSEEVVTQEALDYIDRQKDGPFFLHLALQIPHASLRAKEEWKDKYRPILKEKRLPDRRHPHYSWEREPKTTYAAMVSYMDHNIGLILDRLEEHGIAENTLVFFASDNGAMQEGGHKRDSFDSNGDLRGGKRDLTEGGIRTPMIAWWPGTIAAGSTTDHISAFWDISPTVRELAQAEAQADTDGISMVPVLTGQGEQDTHDYMYWEFFEQGGKRAIIEDEWKLILYQTNTALKPRAELYYLTEDMGETKDLSKKHPEKVKALTQLMDSARTPCKSELFKLARERSPEELARMTAPKKKKGKK